MSNATSVSDLRAAIAASNQDFMTFYKAGDAAGVASLYTQDAQLLMPHSEPVVGRPAIQAVFQGFLEAGIKEAILGDGEIEAHGDIGTEIAPLTLLGEGGQVIDRGKYVVIWKREDDRWKLHRDMFNTSLPESK